MDGFDARYESADEIARDSSSVLYRAVDREDGATWLVRRLIESHRNDEVARGGLSAEGRYTVGFACARCPEAEAIALGDGELVLEYRGGPGVELDRVLSTLEASGRVLEPPAAVALVSEVLHNAETISLNRPPAVTTETWGHGEITPRSVMLGRDGFGRLYETRLVSSGYRAVRGHGSDLFRAPELLKGTGMGTPAGDVYSVGAVMAYALLGAATFVSVLDEPLVAVIVRRVAEMPNVMPAALYEVLIKAVAERADDRFVGPTELRDALRSAMPLDLDGWRATAEGLAELARTLGSDRRITRIPDTVFLTYPRLARPIGMKRPSIDPALISFGTEKALSSHELDDALNPLATGDLAPKNVLPRRIAVMPRRHSQERSWPPPPEVSLHVESPAAPPSETEPHVATVHTISAPPEPIAQAKPPEEPVLPPPEPPKKPMLEVIPSNPAPSLSQKVKPTLEIIPSNPAPQPAPRSRSTVKPVPKRPSPTVETPRPSWGAFLFIVAAFVALVCYMILTEGRPRP